MAFGYSERMEKKDNKICECGHKRHDHSYHYDNNQCFILGCNCAEFKEAAQHRLHQTAGGRGSKKSKVVVPAAGKA